jgi:hypothetical protein
VIRINKPYFVLFFPYIVKTIIVSFLWLYPVSPDVRTFKTLEMFNTVLMSDTDSPDEHEGDYPGAAALIGYVLVADELASAMGAEVILFAVAFFRFGLWWGSGNRGM